MLRALYDVERGGEGLADALEDLRIRTSEAIAKGARALVISDRDLTIPGRPFRHCWPCPRCITTWWTPSNAPRSRWWSKGDAREVHHIAMLIGFGAAAVNPYLAFESIEDLIREGELTGIEPAAAVRNYLKALGKGVMKVMSKMGISTVGSYTAAQAFEAIGLDREVVDEYFTGTPSQGGVGLDVSPKRSSNGTAAPIRRTRPSGCTAAWRWAASTPSGARASCTCSHRKSCSCCSIRPAPAATTSSSSTPTK